MPSPVLSPIIEFTEIDPNVLMPTTQANQAMLDLEQGALGEIVIALADADLTLSTDQLKHYTFVFTGALTVDRNIKVPATARPFDVFNDTTGGHSLVFKTVSGSGVTVKNGTEQIVRCDGINVIAVTAPIEGGAAAGPIYPTRVFTSAGNTTANPASDYLVVVRKASGAATTVFLEGTIPGLSYKIKDGKGDASTNNITIQAAADVSPANGLIDGSATLLITLDYGAVELIYDGSQWNVV